MICDGNFVDFSCSIAALLFSDHVTNTIPSLEVNPEIIVEKVLTEFKPFKPAILAFIVSEPFSAFGIY
ncbi:MAG: hypothetical protein RR325_02455 [Bacilli bacterium]